MVTMAVLVLGGTCLVLWGLRGKRLDEHPVCRACGFDLSGLRGERDAGQSARAAGPEGIRVCPECGRSLEHASAIIVGNRRRRPAAVLVGSVMLLGGMIPAASVLPWLQTAWWIAHKPAWMLELDTYVASSTGTALSELARRRGAGELSDAALARVARHGLAIQKDRSIPWDTRWGDLIVAADAVQGLLMEEEIVGAIRNSVSVDAPMVDRCRVGDPLALIYRVNIDRVVPIARLGVASTARFRWGGLQADSGLHTHELNAGSASVAISVYVPQLQPGTHEGTVTVTMTPFEGKEQKPFGEAWTITAPFSLSVLPRDAQIVTSVTNDNLLASVRRAVSLANVSIDTSPPVQGERRNVRIMATLLVKPLPITIVSRLRAAVRSADEGDDARDGPSLGGDAIEIPFGAPIRLDARSGEAGGTYRGFVSQEIDRAMLRRLGKRLRVDLILTPDTKLAEELACWRILGNELTIEGSVVEFDDEGLEHAPAPAAR